MRWPGRGNEALGDVFFGGWGTRERRGVGNAECRGLECKSVRWMDGREWGHESWIFLELKIYELRVTSFVHTEREREPWSFEARSYVDIIRSKIGAYSPIADIIRIFYFIFYLKLSLPTRRPWRCRIQEFVFSDLYLLFISLRRGGDSVVFRTMLLYSCGFTVWRILRTMYSTPD